MHAGFNSDYMCTINTKILCVGVYTVKPVLSVHSKKDKSKDLKIDYRIKQVKSIAECSKGHSTILLTCFMQ